MSRDPWRLRCPNGHTHWSRRGDHYKCRSCNTEFDRLIDAKHDRPVESPQLY